MIELYKDFNEEAWSGKYDAVCCTTNSVVKNNGELVMGAGIAKIFKEKFPHLPKEWGKVVKEQIDTHLIVSYTVLPNHKLATLLIAFPTKYHWKDKSSLDLIRRSTEQLLELVNKLNLSSVLLPRPGCSNGGLNWEHEVKPILNILDDRFIIISEKTCG